jgi:L-arabinose isomerase
MNLNQAAHGDREHGFIGARMRIPRKLLSGIGGMKKFRKRSAVGCDPPSGYKVSKNLKVMRFGDNMRNVAVTEGDKIETQIKLGWQVNTWTVGELADEIEKVTSEEIDRLVREYESKYILNTEKTESVRYQAREEIAIKRMLDREGASAFSNTFEDLWGMEQLPGLATQHLMEMGYGYGGEGDWKTAAMVHIVKKMTEGIPGGTTL